LANWLSHARCPHENAGGYNAAAVTPIKLKLAQRDSVPQITPIT